MTVCNFDLHRLMLAHNANPVQLLPLSLSFFSSMHTKIELFSYGKVTIASHSFVAVVVVVVAFLLLAPLNAFNLLQWKIRKTRDKKKTLA